MEPNTSDSAPQQTPAAVAPGSSMTKTALIIAGVIAVIVLIGIFLWQPDGDMMANDPATSVADESWMPTTTSDSDDAAAIQSELQATDMDNFEALMQSDTQAASSGI